MNTSIVNGLVMLIYKHPGLLSCDLCLYLQMRGFHFISANERISFHYLKSFFVESRGAEIAYWY